MDEHKADDGASIDDILASIRQIIAEDETRDRSDVEKHPEERVSEENIKDLYINPDFSSKKSEESVDTSTSLYKNDQDTIKIDIENYRKEQGSPTREEVSSDVQNQKHNEEPARPSIDHKGEMSSPVDEVAEDLEALFSPLSIEEEEIKEETEGKGSEVLLMSEKKQKKPNVRISSVEFINSEKSSITDQVENPVKKDLESENKENRVKGETPDKVLEKQQDAYNTIRPEEVSEPILERNHFDQPYILPDFSIEKMDRESDNKELDSQIEETRNTTVQEEKNIPPERYSVNKTEVESLVHAEVQPIVEKWVKEHMSSVIEEEVRLVLTKTLSKTLENLSYEINNKTD